MVMNFGTYDINLHMLNHYKRISSAKNVVNTRSRRKNSKNCNKTGSVTSVNSRYSTPTFSSGRRAESSQSSYQQKSLIKNEKHVRVSSAQAKNGKKSKSDSAAPSEQTSPKEIDELQCPNNTNTSLFISESPSVPIKTPVPTPRTVVDKNLAESPGVPDFEYLQFSLRITEDIIRNDLYTNKEMQRVFNSHLEANRGRLNMKKMLEQIDLLCTELNIGKNSEKSDCKYSQNTSISVRKSKKKDLKSKELKSDIINKILSGEKLMTDDEIQKLNENELQDIITKLLTSHEEYDEKIINKKTDSIFSLNYEDLLRKPEMTVEEVLDISLNEETPQIIKHNLLSPDIQIEDYSEFSNFNFETYIDKDFPKMGIDVSVQTSLEEIEAKEELNNKECCMYKMGKKEKSTDILMDEIVTESSIFLNKNEFEENTGKLLLKKEELRLLKNICKDYLDPLCNKINEIPSLKSDIKLVNSAYIEKSKSYPTFIGSKMNCPPDIIEINSAPNISLTKQCKFLKNRLNYNKFRYPSFLCLNNNDKLEMEENFIKQQKLRGDVFEYEKMNIFDLTNFDNCLSELNLKKYDFNFEKYKNISWGNIKTFKSLENLTDTFNLIDNKMKKADDSKTEFIKFNERLNKVENYCKDIFEINNDTYVKIEKTRSDNSMFDNKFFELNSKLLFTDQFKNKLKSKSLTRLDYLIYNQKENFLCL